MSGKPFSLPEGFRFGVATAGFQVEGGYNGPGQPRNNWYRWEHTRRVEPSGTALDFWNRYEEQLDRAVDAGCNAFRLSVEWARCEPAEEEIDLAAFQRYADILRACRDRGLEPLVTLHHFTHPHWLGVDFWLQPDAPERFAGWVRTAVDRLGELCRQWVTINEPNSYALNSYLVGYFPPGRRFDRKAVLRTFDQMLRGHVLAYGEIHDRQPDALVAINNFSFFVYLFDRLLVDVLLARRYGIPKGELTEWLFARKAAWEASLPQPSAAEGLLRRVIAASIPLGRVLPGAVESVYASPYPCTLDATQIDYYNPMVSSRLRVPGHRTAGGRNWFPVRMLWDDPPDPRGLLAYSRLAYEPGLPVWIVENGLCNRSRDGISYPRLDGWDRERYLRANLGSVVQAIDAGVPIASYYHWTLADNWEWGSYEPCFGLYRAERTNGRVSWSAADSMGGNAARAYRRIIEGLRAGNRSVVAEPGVE